MFESIIQQFQEADYDFRKTAHSADPLSHLFTEWVDYYRLKWTIAHVLKPTSILEVGVRFGYSAIAFLEGHPAHYVGIDLDTDLYGGVKGAIHWAKAITESFDAKFIVADTQQMQRFPGGLYDLIHVDGQQDGDGSFHDLELAIQQSRYILVDGYLWTRQNFMAISDFLLRYADLIEWYGVIPGYAGELLIKVSPIYVEEREELPPGSLSLRQTYTTDYYTQDCGGFESYKKHQGKKLEDSRLQAVASIASLKPSGCVLDLGCGRGELAYYFAAQGYDVTAIDYSENAIALAEKCFEGEPHLRRRVELLCDNVCTVQLPQQQYDLAIASDVIEHLSSPEVETLYQQAANLLKSDGLFIVHTFPNLWYYRYEYARRQRVAASVGAYLPSQPRSRYELLMHINEQSPRVLKKQLSQAFENVLLWFGDLTNPGGSLVEKFSKQEICAAPSLFAVASHQAIDREKLKACLSMARLPALLADQLRLVVCDHPASASVEGEFQITVELTNYTNFTFNSFNPYPVHLSYHWMEQTGESNVIFDGQRSVLLPPLVAGSKKTFLHSNGVKRYQVRILAPKHPGQYRLRVTLVQEQVQWFDAPPTQLKQDLSIEVN
jgi:2-polyprenyl-3-methyl-5-hydroxy-6-metoxy-1,4-benzoquinol methylase